MYLKRHKYSTNLVQKSENNGKATVSQSSSGNSSGNNSGSSNHSC